MKFKLVVATRESESDFFNNTATGKSISICKPPFLELKIFPENDKGLSELYNKVIVESKNDPSILIFAHDDIHFLDYFWCNRIEEGLKVFDILGVAGNRNRSPKQPSWAFVDDFFNWDKTENLSGVVGHGKSFPPKNLSVYGRPRQKVKLLDGLLLAAHSDKLNSKDVYFDKQFDFHFYDLDFCRTAEINNLTCGTWDLSIIHESAGNFNSSGWKTGYQKYLNKWKS